MKQKIGFIGAGKMAEALIKGIQKADLASNITASDRSKERLASMKKATGIAVSSSNADVLKKSKIVFLAVKPQDMGNVLDEIASSVTSNHLMVSSSIARFKRAFSAAGHGSCSGKQESILLAYIFGLPVGATII